MRALTSATTPPPNMGVHLIQYLHYVDIWAIFAMQNRNMMECKDVMVVGVSLLLRAAPCKLLGCIPIKAGHQTADLINRLSLSGYLLTWQKLSSHRDTGCYVLIVLIVTQPNLLIQPRLAPLVITILSPHPKINANIYYLVKMLIHMVIVDRIFFITKGASSIFEILDTNYL